MKYIAKKLIILFLSYLSIQNSQSQIQKGTWCVGLNYANNYVFSPTVGTKGGWSSVIEFPNVGYFITNRIFVGVSTSIHIPAKNIQILFGDAIPNVYSFNPNVRLYFGQNKLKLFTQAQYRFGRQNLGKYDARTAIGTIQTYESINRVQVFQAQVGVSYLLNNKLSLETGFYLDRTFKKLKGEQADLFTGQILAPQSEKYTNGGIRFGLLFHFN